jgi:DNA-binding winged helix-turn-helix (wHTH) protein
LVFRFEDFQFDCGRRELRRRGQSIAIAPQTFDLIEYLIRHRDRVVGKDELIASIWDGRFVSESVLTTRLNVARAAIGDNGKRQRFIKTFPRKGLRFVGIIEDEEALQPAHTPRQPRPRGGPTLTLLRLLIDPEDPGHASLAEALTDEFLVELTKRRWLRASTAMSTLDEGKIERGMASGPNYRLHGRLQRNGGETSLVFRLTDETGAHLWAARYSRGAARPLSEYRETAGAVIAAACSAILREERQRILTRPSENLDAWESCQLGLWYMSQCDVVANEKARKLFQHATELDAGYASAHGALAWSHMMAASIFSQMPIAEGCALGDPLICKAIVLDDSDMDVRSRLALAALLKGDLEGACREAEQILSVDGNCGAALGVKGAALIYSGRQKAGRAAIGRYLGLSAGDPARPIRMSQLATSLYLDGQFESAATTASAGVRQYPDHPLSYRWLAASLGELGKIEQGREVLSTLLARWPSSIDMYVRSRTRYCDIEHRPLLAGLRKVGWKE